MSFVYDQYPFFAYDIWGTFGRFDGLIWGVVLAVIYKHYKNIFEYFKYIHPLFVAAMLVAVYILPIPLRPTWEAILYPVLIGSTIYRENSMISRALEIEPLKYLGRLSYSIYLWHMIFMVEIPKAPSWLQVVSGNWYSLIAVFILSMGSYHLIENPIRCWGYGLIKRIS
jgi:peptidoglycan/LPS O-acetylase OafA/YrhL